jgi:hypothetical protein
VMWMNAGRATHLFGMLLYQRNRGVRASQRATGNQHTGDTDLGGTLYDCIAIVIEAVVRQVQPDIQQSWRRGR